MASKTSKKGTNKVISLKDFHETVSAPLPAENNLPSKPARRDAGRPALTTPKEIEDPELQRFQPHTSPNGLRPGGPLSQASKFPSGQPSQATPQQLPLSFRSAAIGLTPAAVDYGSSFPQGGRTAQQPQQTEHNLGVQQGANAPKAKQWGPSAAQPPKQGTGSAASSEGSSPPGGNMLHMAVPRRAQAAQHSSRGRVTEALAGNSRASPEKPPLEAPSQKELPLGDDKQPALVRTGGPDGRPVLNIKPRTLPAEVQANKGPARDDSAMARERPRLNLKPRSTVGEANIAMATPPQRSSSVFGEALPREVVLTNRGQPDKSAQLDRSVSAPAIKSTPQGGSWQSVQTRRKAGYSGSSYKASQAVTKQGCTVDPFFSDYIPSSRSFSAMLGDVEVLEAPKIDRRRSDDSRSAALSKRSLPIRSDDFF